MSVSKALQYGKAPIATFSTKYRNTIHPTNGSTFTPGQVIKIAIPCGTPQEFMNCRQSFLKLQLNNTHDTNALVLDLSAHALISEVSVYYGGTLLERIENYGALYTALFEAGADPGRGEHAGAIAEGMTSTRAGLSIPKEDAEVFCLGLMLGTVGLNQSRYIPLQDLTMGHLELHIKLASEPQAQKAASEAAKAEWTVSHVSFNAETLVLNSEVAKEISRMNAAGGGYVLPYSSWRAQSAIVPQGSTSVRQLITDNCRSLKTIVTAMHESADASLYAGPWVSGRVNPFDDARYNWNYTVLGQKVPRTPVSSDEESFIELQRSMHALSGASQHGNIAKSEWAATTGGSFMLAQCVEPMTHASSLSQSGVDVSTSPMYLEAEFASGMSNLTVWHYLHYDADLMITPTGAQSVY